MSGKAYTFFKGEPIPRIQLKAPFALSTAVSSVPTLPPGLKFYVSGSNLDISGTPLTTLPTSNYLLIGKDVATGSKVITTSNTYTVSNERIVYNQSGTPIFNMNIGTPIASRTLTAAFPPYPSGGTLTYTWNTFPDGIRVFDFNGTDKTISNNFGFPTTDVSHAFTISGTPTLTAAYQFANAGVTSAGVTYSIKGTRTSPLPAILSNADITFAFNETVLFDQSAIPTLYSGVPVNSNANFFRAKTYFSSGSGTNIASIFSPDLRADLSLNRIGSNAYLFAVNPSGPTLGASSANYTIRATNSNGFTRDYVTPITVADDVIQFVSPTPAIDVCYNFILSRPVDVPKTGYYPYPIQFKAQAASGLPVTLSAPALAGTGMSLDSNGTIVGLPDTVTPLSTLAVIATATGSPATATRNVKIEVINDIFTFGTVPSSNFNFNQNRAITPFQIPVTTLSERPVVGFSENALPDGLSISPAGVISGTPLSSDVSGTFAIIPTTGYTSSTKFFDYTTITDNILLTVPNERYTYIAGDNVLIPITGTSYSGTTVSNYSITLDPSYGLSISPVTGLITGTWTDSIPPNFVLPPSTVFTVNSSSGLVNGVLGAQLTVDPVVANEQFIIARDIDRGYSLLECRSDYLDWYTFFEASGSSSLSDVQFKNRDPLGNVVLITANAGYLYRGTVVSNITTIDFGEPAITPYTSGITNKTGTSTWWLAGRVYDTTITGVNKGVVLRSDDDGLTWNTSSASQVLISGLNFNTRDSNGTISPLPGQESYGIGGAAIKYKYGVLLLGGADRMGRSINDGVSWTSVVNGFSTEIANYCLDCSGMWICTGSSGYKSLIPTAYAGDVTTIKYSTDQGVSWSNANGAFNMFGYEVVYGSNTWLATGVTYNSGTNQYSAELRYSLNGIDWSLANVGVTVQDSPTNDIYAVVAPLQIQAISFNEIYWNVAVTRPRVDDFSQVWLYRHDISSSLASGWYQYSAVSGGEFFPRVFGITTPHYFKTDTGDITLNLAFQTGSTSGPIITSPTIRSYLLYQYMSITPIQLSATGTGNIYWYTNTEQLPIGLVFDPFTNQITGTPAQIGTTSIKLYVTDDNGFTEIVISFRVIIPRIVRKQDGAGAYTSLLRQYTEVLGAQNARDNRVLPNQDRTLGEFMSPDAPDVVTPFNCKK